MNVLFPYSLSEADNQFVQIHIRILQDLGCDVTASMDEFWQPTKSYDLLVINWPDYFFAWRDNIKDDEVVLLNNTLLNWKSVGTNIITFFHDEYSHFGRSANLNLLFDICYGKSNILIHLGEYSKNKYSSIYHNAIHCIIHHPKYEKFDMNADPWVQRKQLGIKKNECFVLVPGAIRKREEIDYALKVFRSVTTPEKRMLFMRTSFLKKPTSIRSVNELKSAIYWLIFKNKYRFRDQIVFQDGFKDFDQFSQLMAAANIVVIPRTDILNSGNIILAAQFGKHIVGTGKGNMGELLKFLEQTVYSSDSIGMPINDICNSGLVDRSLQVKIEKYSGYDVVSNQWKELLHL